jgi:hypothetical protein
MWGGSREKHSQNSAVVEDFIKGLCSPGSDVCFGLCEQVIQTPGVYILFDLRVPGISLYLRKPLGQLPLLGAREFLDFSLDFGDTSHMGKTTLGD